MKTVEQYAEAVAKRLRKGMMTGTVIVNSLGQYWNPYRETGEFYGSWQKEPIPSELAYAAGRIIEQARASDPTARVIETTWRKAGIEA